MDAEQPLLGTRRWRSPVDVAATKPELLRMAILLALMESPALQEKVDVLEQRVAELLGLGEEEIRRRGRALQAQRNN